MHFGRGFGGLWCQPGARGVPAVPGRSLSWKWLSLQHPRHRDGRCQGLLQVSLAVRRAGERAQVSAPPSPAPQNPSRGSPRCHTPTKEQEMPAGNEDVEANLLRPPACATTLQIRVFRGEELPWGGDSGNGGDRFGVGTSGNWDGDSGN